MRERVDRLGGGAVSPERSYAGLESLPKTRAMVDKAPGSTNPSAESLTFPVADEKRDVAKRLGELQSAEDVSGARELDLATTFRQAQQTAREHISAEEDYILAGIRLLIERHQFDPRLFAESTVRYDETHTDGNRAMTLNLLNQAGVRQRLPYGGEVSARWVFNAVENLRNQATGRYVQSSSLVLSGTVPLLRGAGDIAQEALIQSERDLVYAARDFESFRRRFLVALARDYFDLLLQLDGIESRRRQLQSFVDLESRQRAWYEAGKLPEFEVNLATSNVLQARASLTNTVETYILALDRFKVRLGVQVRTPMKVIASELTIPEPAVSLEQSTDLALEYRLDLQNQRDRLEDSRRQVVNARNQLLPDLTAFGNVTFPTKASAREGGSVYELDDARYSVGATFSLPLDRREEALRLRAQTITLARAQREYDRFRDELVLDVRAKTREIERARFNLYLAEERVKINLRRREEQSLKPDEVTTREQVLTSNDLLDSELARNQARADLRNAVLNYLLATGTLRVNRDGTFRALPGMEQGGGGTATPATPPGGVSAAGNAPASGVMGAAAPEITAPTAPGAVPPPPAPEAPATGATGVPEPTPGGAQGPR